MDELLREFIAETTEHLAVFERDLVALARAPNNRPLIDDIFRNVHSIKGTCSFLGLKRLESLLHAAENALGKLRDEALPAVCIAIGVLLGACDRAKTIVAALAQDGGEPEDSDIDIVARLELAMHASPVLSSALSARVAPAVPTPGAISSDPQESATKLGPQPIGKAWTKLPRILCDLARDLGKKIELRLEGSEIELDRNMLALIKDAFIHLLRNAADHGIEAPDERRRAGKAETGTIALSARNEGGVIVVTLSDDGRGIDPERLRAAVRTRGLASDAELRVMDAPQLLQFIFHPGFTTAAQVTKVSGRGVGLDVVRSNVEKIGGAVDVASEPGHGARFTIKIPLTAGIAPPPELDSSSRLEQPKRGDLQRREHIAPRQRAAF